LGFNLQPANYAIETKEYMAKTGTTEEDISLVSVKNRKNASLNPNARFQTPVTVDEVLSSRMIATPLRLLHCCPLADGAAAAIVCSQDKLKSMSRAVKIRSCILTSAPYGDEYLPGGLVGSVKYQSRTSAATLSAKQAYEASGCGPEDIDIAQLYDTVSTCELWEAEELGLCDEGEALGLLRQGYFNLDGKLPVNTDGGLMGRGHPMGATGLGQVVELVTQLRGEAGPRQVQKATLGLSHAMGVGPNSSLTILSK
jgi:acetyl-CoA acetyltransferase